jgi:hypothetical protein
MTTIVKKQKNIYDNKRKEIYMKTNIRIFSNKNVKCCTLRCRDLIGRLGLGILTTPIGFFVEGLCDHVALLRRLDERFLDIGRRFG